MSGMSARILLSLSVLLFCVFSLSSSQTLSNLPECWQACITSANNFNCATLDVPCKFNSPSSCYRSRSSLLRTSGVCQAWNGGVLASALSCIKSTCDPSLDADLLISPLELFCDLAGVSVSSAVISSALQTATTPATMTRYVTDTVTESYYWQSTFETISTTVVVPVTGSDGHTVIVAFPVTIEPSTTVYGAPSTSIPDSHATSSPNLGYDFGSCSNPGIFYGYGLDYQSQYAFEPSDQNQFPHGASPDIATVESFICKRLRDTCHASSDAQKACNGAFDAYSGLAGQNAADVWNVALGLPATTRASTTTTVTVTSTASTAPSVTSSITSVTTTATANQAQGMGEPGTITATVTSTVGAAGSLGSPNADGGGSPFSMATQEYPQLLSLGTVLLFVILAICH